MKFAVKVEISYNEVVELGYVEGSSQQDAARNLKLTIIEGAGENNAPKFIWPTSSQFQVFLDELPELKDFQDLAAELQVEFHQLTDSLRRPRWQRA